MPADKITLEIVTPDGVCLEAQVSEFTAPSIEGQFGALPGHRPLLAALSTGIVSYRTGDAEQRVAVGAGFVELFEDHAVLLTDRFITRGDVDPVHARLELKEADEQLEKLQADPEAAEYAQALARELWAAVQLELYGDPPPPTVRTVTELQVSPKGDYVSEGLYASESPEAAPPEAARGGSESQ
jgi:F-type H+-transporting ATPase subunit epsilon